MIHLQNRNILAPAHAPGLTLPRPLPTTGVPLFPHNPPATVVPPSDPRLLESKAKFFFVEFVQSAALKTRKKVQKSKKILKFFFRTERSQRQYDQVFRRRQKIFFIWLFLGSASK